MITQSKHNTTLEFEPNSYRGVIDYFDSLDMRAQFIDGFMVYRSGRSKIIVDGVEGKPGRLVLNGVDDKVFNEIKARIGGKV